MRASDGSSIPPPLRRYEYLTVLQRHAEQVAAAPELWLPWNYQAQLAPA